MNRSKLYRSQSETMKRAVLKRPQIRVDQESFDSGTGMVFIRGWVLADGPVKLRIYDGRKNRVPCKLHRESRKDIVKAYQTILVEDQCGFYGEFPAEKGKVYYLAARTDRGRISVHRILPGESEPGKRGTAGQAADNVRRMAFSAAERAGQLKDYGAAGTLQILLGRAARKAGREWNFPSYWYELMRTREAELERQRKNPPEGGPLFRVFVTDSTDGKPGRTLRKSLEEQTYPGWTISKNDEETSNDDRGTFLLLCRKEDHLEPDALYRFAEYLLDDPETEMIYPDEIRRPQSGIGVSEILLKPGFSPDFLCSTNYIGHVFAVRADLAAKAGGPAARSRRAAGGVEPAVAELDYLLKCVENTEHVGHVPAILFETRERSRKTPALVKEMIPVLRAHYRRTGFESAVSYDAGKDVFRTSLSVKGTPKVSILIPNKDHVEDLRKCIASICARSSWKNYEILIIENNSEKEETFRYYDELEKDCPEARILYYTEKPVFENGTITERKIGKSFNYPLINDFGVQHAKGEYLLLLNNDTEVITKDWMEKMLGFCQREDTGIVGVKLYYPDDTIQHAGVIVGLSGGAEHMGAREPGNRAGYMKRYAASQNLSAVTAACMMVKKAVYEEVGGMDPEFAVSFNDVDFCLRVREAGYRIVYDADVELYHYESKSRGVDATKEQTERAMKELKLLQTRHRGFMEQGDPYYHPWLHPTRLDYSLAEPETLIREG